MCQVIFSGQTLSDFARRHAPVTPQTWGEHFITVLHSRRKITIKDLTFNLQINPQLSHNFYLLNHYILIITIFYNNYSLIVAQTAFLLMT